MGNELTVKFLRSHSANNSLSQNAITQYHLKLIYEFWGFCVNGTNSLTIPGGFAQISGALAPNYISMPVGFESGSSALLASGSDGQTTYGQNVFTAPSVNWTSGSMVGKWLVCWQSGSTSTDDSIYPITRVLSSSSIVVDTNVGATPMSMSNNQPRFTDRSAINYRVVDLIAAASITDAVGQYMILQFNAYAVNSGQALSQVKMLKAAGFVGTASAVNFILSPSGSWNGSTFSDASQAQAPDVVSQAPDWFNSNAGGQNYITLMADQNALIMHTKGSWSGSTQIHIEIPTRLFPQVFDPNPICSINVGNQTVNTSMTANGDTCFGSGWLLPTPGDSAVYRRHVAMCRCLAGDGNSGGDGNSSLDNGFAGILAGERFRQAGYNVRTKKYVILDVVLGHRQVNTSYTMGRVQLRRATIAPGSLQTDVKLGTNGEWISVSTGLLWPWDNSSLPHSLFPLGT